MVECTVEKAFEILSIRIRTEMKYALDRLNKATSPTAKQQACDALSEAVWNWEAYNTIWQLAQGDIEDAEDYKLGVRRIATFDTAN